MNACVKCKSARGRWSLSQARSLRIRDMAIVPWAIIITITADRVQEARTMAVREEVALRSIQGLHSPRDRHTTEEIL